MRVGVYTLNVFLLYKQALILFLLQHTKKSLTWEDISTTAVVDCKWQQLLKK